MQDLRIDPFRIPGHGRERWSSERLIQLFENLARVIQEVSYSSIIPNYADI